MSIKVVLMYLNSWNIFFIISLRGRVKKIIKINIIEYFLIDKKKKLRNWINQSNLKIISII
jgi:hypothetical protein